MQLNPALTKKLYAAFAHLYRGRHKPKYASSMCWGFECGDGWYQLLYDLSQELSRYMAEHPEVDFEVTQVKSKLGTLRFHISNMDAQTARMIEHAQERASVTCEISGNYCSVFW